MSFVVEGLSVDNEMWNFSRLLSNTAAIVGLIMVSASFILLFYNLIG